jgi:hypothetical protein
MKIIIFLCSLVCFPVLSQAQFFPKNEAQADSLYQANIKKSRIRGVYIPKNLDEVFEELKALSTPAATQKFALGEEDIVAERLHFGIGRWMRINWNFEQGSRLVQYLKDLGIYRINDMSDFLIRVYHRHLNQRPLEIEGLVEKYDRAWNDEKLKKSEGGILLSSKKIEPKK